MQFICKLFFFVPQTPLSPGPPSGNQNSANKHAYTLVGVKHWRDTQSRVLPINNQNQSLQLVFLYHIFIHTCSHYNFLYNYMLAFVYIDVLYIHVFMKRIKIIIIAYRWQRVKTSHKQNAQCSGNTKKLFQKQRACCFYFCHFYRLHSGSLINRIFDNTAYTAKCNIMRVSRMRLPFLYSYKLSGQVLDEVKDSKYLGVTISNNLDWSKHITTTTTKANARLSFIKRILKDCPQMLKEIAYFSLVRSFVDYASAVWDPHQKFNQVKLEMVQRRAARFVKSRYRRTDSVP